MAMQRHIDATISNVVGVFKEKVKQDIGRQVDHFDNFIIQNQMSVSTIGDYKISLDKLTTRIENVTSLVEGMVVGPQPHYEGPPTVPSVFGRLVDPIEEQQPDVVQVSDTHVIRRSNASQRGSVVVRATPTVPPAPPSAAVAPPVSISTVPGPVHVLHLIRMSSKFYRISVQT